jgi:hypothetical protein
MTRKFGLAGIALLLTASLSWAHGSNYKKEDFIRLIEERDAKIAGYKAVVTVLTQPPGGQVLGLLDIFLLSYENWSLVLYPALQSENPSQDLWQRIAGFNQLANMIEVQVWLIENVHLPALDAIPEPDVYDPDVHDTRAEYRPLIEQRELKIDGPGGYKDFLAALTRVEPTSAPGLLAQVEPYLPYWDDELETQAYIESSPSTDTLICNFDNCYTEHSIDQVEVARFYVNQTVAFCDAIPEPEAYDEHRAY